MIPVLHLSSPCYQNFINTGGSSGRLALFTFTPSKSNPLPNCNQPDINAINAVYTLRFHSRCEYDILWQSGRDTTETQMPVKVIKWPREDFKINILWLSANNGLIYYVFRALHSQKSMSEWVQEKICAVWCASDLYVPSEDNKNINLCRICLI